MLPVLRVPAHLHLPFGAVIQQDEALGGSLEQSGFHRLWRGTLVGVYIPHHPQQGFEEHREPARHSAGGNSNTNPLELGESTASLSSSHVLQAGPAVCVEQDCSCLKTSNP